MKIDKMIMFPLLLWLAVACTPGAETVLSTPTAVTDSGQSAPSPSPLSEPPSITAAYGDHLAVADQFTLTAVHLPAPPEGQAYQGWLLGNDGTTVSVGALALAPDGSAALVWDSPNSENLLSRYTRFQMTLEPAAGSASPAGPVVFAGGLEGVQLAVAQRLFVRNDGEPATPLNIAFAPGLLAQTDLAAQHVTNASNAAAIGALDEMRAHLEHVVNILAGADDPRFGDHDGNGTAENPGDGFGVLGYTAEITAILNGQAGVDDTAATIQTQTHVIQDACLEILTVGDTETAVPQLSALQTMIDQMQSGPVMALYQAAQESVQFAVAPVE